MVNKLLTTNLVPRVFKVVAREGDPGDEVWLTTCQKTGSKAVSTHDVYMLLWHSYKSVVHLL